MQCEIKTAGKHEQKITRAFVWKFKVSENIPEIN